MATVKALSASLYTRFSLPLWHNGTMLGQNCKHSYHKLNGEQNIASKSTWSYCSGSATTMTILKEWSHQLHVLESEKSPPVPSERPSQSQSLLVFQIQARQISWSKHKGNSDMQYWDRTESNIVLWMVEENPVLYTYSGSRVAKRPINLSSPSFSIAKSEYFYSGAAHYLYSCAAHKLLWSFCRIA